MNVSPRHARVAAARREGGAVAHVAVTETAVDAIATVGAVIAMAPAEGGRSDAGVGSRTHKAPRLSQETGNMERFTQHERDTTLTGGEEATERAVA